MRGQPPSSLGARCSRWLLGSALVSIAAGAAAACDRATTKPVGATAVTVSAGALPSGPAPTIDRLPIGAVADAWQPPSAVAGDPHALGLALRSATRIHVQLGPRLDGELWRKRVPEVLRELGVLAPVAFVTSAELGTAIDGPLPVRSIATGAIETSAIELKPAWRARVAEGAGAGTVVLAIDDAAIDEARWRALPSAAIGSCDAPMQTLALGQEQGLAELEPFLDHADAILWQLWRAELRALLPEVRRPLAPHAAPRARKDAGDAAAWREHECGHALWQLTEPYHRCAASKSPCALAPRMLLVGGLRIGAPEPDVFVPRGCTDVIGSDVVLQLRALGRDAAEAASERLDPRWVVLADRLGAITEVHAALEDVCAPRRRRFAPVDLEDARTRVDAIVRELGSDEPPRAGKWTFEPSAFHVPGIGPVREHGRFDAGAGSAAHAAIEGARSLREFVLSRALCRAAVPALPLAVLAYEPHSTDAAKGVRWFGYLYEEELSCGTLGPDVARG